MALVTCLEQNPEWQRKSKPISREPFLVIAIGIFFNWLLVI